MAYCPSCISFREECNPEPEDYDSPCKYFKDAEEELRKEWEADNPLDRSEIDEDEDELKEHQRGGLAHPHEFIKKKKKRK